MSSALCRLVEHRFQNHSLQTRLAWRQRIEGQLWRHGNLTLQDYTLLALQPKLVAHITHPEKISLDIYLGRVLALQAYWKIRVLTSPECWERVLLHDDYSRQLELVQQLAAAGNLPEAFLVKVVRADRLDLMIECLRLGAVPTSEVLAAALKQRAFVMAELFMQPPYNLVPSIYQVIASGRVDYLDRFGLRELFLELPLRMETLAQSSPAMLELRLGQSPHRASLLVDICNAAIQYDTPASVEILRYVLSLPEGSSYIAQAITRRQPKLRSVATLMENYYSSALLEIVVEVLIQHDL